MASSNPKILITGSTGYIGGSALAQLLSSPDASRYGPISCLIRGEERQKILTDKYGDKVRPILFKDLDDTERIIEVASQHDIIINTTIGFHSSSARNLVLGLSKRRQETGRDTWIIHTSGTSNLADQPITKTYLENRDFSDRDEDIYEYEKKREAAQPYPQRTSELAVIDAGVETGVKTLVIMSPIIYGIGTGLFNKLAVAVPYLVRDFTKHGYAIVVGDGKNVWDHVHIADVAKLYQIVLDKILAGGADVPYGKKGIIFSAAGRHSGQEISQGIADAVFKAGKIKSNELRNVGIKEGVEFISLLSIMPHREVVCELAFASNSRTKAEVAKSLGWKPEKGAKDWEASFEEETQAVLAEGLWG